MTRGFSKDMTRRDFMKVSGAASVLGGALANQAAAEAEAAPNIFLIITDQQHIDTIAAGGCPHVATPAMDRLMRRGVSFSLSHSANPVCSPARSAMLSGRATSETGVWENTLAIRDGIPNIGQWFGELSDYETIYTGKWHLPKSCTLDVPGFNVLTSTIGGQGNLGDAAVSRACEAYLHNRSNDRPFLMIASFLQPHDICEWLRLDIDVPDEPRYPELADKLPGLPANFEFDPREPAAIKTRRNDTEPAWGNWTKRHWRYYLWSYYRHVEMVDAEIGRLLQGIEDTGYGDDTVILFTADHGEGMAHHRNVRKDLPYDEALRVPFVISWPGHFPEDKRDAAHLVSGLDVMPTLCDCAGIEPPPNMRGRSLRPLLEGKTDNWRTHIVCEIDHDQARVVRSQRYKYVTYDGDPIGQLFDMRDDPHEKANLAPDAQHADVVAEHRAMLEAWERELDVAPGLPGKDAWWRKA